MCRIKEIGLILSMPEFEKSNINPEVREDYRAMMGEIGRLNQEVARRDKLLALYKEALGGSIALREEEKKPEPAKESDGILKRLKK